MDEIWKSYKTKQADIEISNFGNVRGIKWRGKAFNETVIRLNYKGRRCIGSTQIFTLVWKLFIGPIPKGYCIHHKDRNKLNDRLDNLQLMTINEHCKLHDETQFHKGCTCWCKGKKLSDETRLKMSKAKRNMSDETKRKMSESQKKRRQKLYDSMINAGQ